MDKAAKLKIGIAIGLLTVAIALVAWNMMGGSSAGDNPTEKATNKALENARPRSIQ